MLSRVPAAGVLLFLLALVQLFPSPRALSQAQEGATMTVLRGR
jgi:hypothetical protein